VDEELLLAIDAGTGSCRAILFDLSGRQVAAAHREYSHPPVPGAPGSQSFDTDGNWQLICACVREALAGSGRPASAVRAIGATSMREGMVLYDAAGSEIWACPNVDSRATDQAAELVQSGAAEQIYRLAGDWVAITAPARLRWIAAREPETFERTAHVGMLGDWILYRLSGQFVTDPSLGSSSGMFDLANRGWSDWIVELCGLDPAVFPDVVEPGTAVGGLTAQAAAETGLDAGTPVVVGGADTQLGLVGIGQVTPGVSTIVGGSFWQHTMVLGEPLIDPEARLRTLCHSVPGQWMIEGIGFYCGLTMRWYRDAFCEVEKELAEREGVDVYELLERLAAQAPAGSNGVLGIFSNLMDAKRWIHASPAFVGFDVAQPAESGKREGVRAIEESAAYVSRGHADIIRDITGREVDEVVFTGGAAKGKLWPQIVSDVLGLPVRIPAVKESTSLGAAMYAGVGAGLYRDVSEPAAEIVHFDRTLEPNAANTETYDDAYERWREVYARSLELAASGVTRPLWRAAGT
jgi:autoinducer 2 (AI-2) kinase